MHLLQHMGSDFSLLAFSQKRNLNAIHTKYPNKNYTGNRKVKWPVQRWYQMVSPALQHQRQSTLGNFIWRLERRIITVAGSWSRFNKAAHRRRYSIVPADKTGPSSRSPGSPAAAMWCLGQWTGAERIVPCSEHIKSHISNYVWACLCGSNVIFGLLL